MTQQSAARQPGRDAAGWWAAPGVARTAVDVPERMREVLESFVDGADLRPLGSQLVGLREVIDQLEAVRRGHSTKAWLRHECRLTPADAQARARLATRIQNDDLPVTVEALDAGSISWRHADVVDRTLRYVPPEHRAEAEEALQQPAKTLDPMLLKRVGQEFLHRLDVEKAEESAVRRLERRGLDLAETLGGMVAVSGLLDPVAGAGVLTAIDSLVSPTRGDDDDEPSWSQRRADALTEICNRYLDSGQAPVSGGVRPHLSVVVDLATLQRQPGCDPATGALDETTTAVGRWSSLRAAREPSRLPAVRHRPGGFSAAEPARVHRGRARRTGGAGTPR